MCLLSTGEQWADNLIGGRWLLCAAPLQYLTFKGCCCEFTGNTKIDLLCKNLDLFFAKYALQLQCDPCCAVS